MPPVIANVWELVTAVTLLAVGIVFAILSRRALLFRAEALVVLAGLPPFFAMGFASPFLDQVWQLAVVALGMAFALAISFAIGRYAATKRVAALAGFVFVPLACIAFGYGIYEARETGWHGLLRLGETSDAPGIWYFWLIFMGLTPFWGLAALALSGLASWVNSLKASQRDERPPSGDAAPLEGPGRPYS
jgi:hypothetical protein